MKELTEIKERFQSQSALLVTILSLVIFLLLFVTSLGIVGLTVFSVAERTRQIGTRRALGARKADILRYFLLENWLVTTMGLVLGVALAYGLNVALVTRLNGTKIDAGLVILGVALLWIAGLAATYFPAPQGPGSLPPSPPGTCDVTAPGEGRRAKPGDLQTVSGTRMRASGCRIAAVSREMAPTLRATGQRAGSLMSRVLIVEDQPAVAKALDRPLRGPRHPLSERPRTVGGPLGGRGGDRRPRDPGHELLSGRDVRRRGCRALPGDAGARPWHAGPPDDRLDLARDGGRSRARRRQRLPGQALGRREASRLGAHPPSPARARGGEFAPAIRAGEAPGGARAPLRPVRDRLRERRDAPRRLARGAGRRRPTCPC